MKRTPAYLRVYSDLKSRILSKKYDIGALLPPEPELEQLYGVSRTTVRKAIAMLMNDGYITVKQGYGTQVISRKVSQNLNVITSISQSLQKKGYTIGVKNTFVEKIRATAVLAHDFRVEEGCELICVHRLQLADGEPVAITKNYILASLVPDIEKNSEEIVSLYEYLLKNYSLRYTDAKDTISAISAGYEEAMLLGVEPKTALMTIKRICNINDVVAEVDDVRIVADKYEFEVYTKGKNV
ncbi:MAG: GntR family transcriptional regulator [Clostridia bacterium]|nr:GntR family transcriptional regulator [Clostridia bacterium]